MVNWKYWLELGVGAGLAGTAIGYVEGFMKGVVVPEVAAGMNVPALATGLLVGYYAEKQTGDIKVVLTGLAAAAVGIGIEKLISGFMPAAPPVD